MFFLVLQMVPDFLEVVSGFNRHPSTNRLTQVPIYIYIYIRVCVCETLIALIIYKIILDSYKNTQFLYSSSVPKGLPSQPSAGVSHFLWLGQCALSHRQLDEVAGTYRLIPTMLNQNVHQIMSNLMITYDRY